MYAEDWWDLTKLAVIVGLAGWGINSCVNSDFHQNRLKEEAAQKAADAQPRVIREKDGCKVYSFKEGGRWHYFTRCPQETTTETTWSEKSGKTTTEHSATLVTPNVKP